MTDNSAYVNSWNDQKLDEGCLKNMRFIRWHENFKTLQHVPRIKENKIRVD